MLNRSLLSSPALTRCSSTLAEKLARVADVTASESPEMETHRIETETDSELFIQPKRKLQSQLTLERMTGRADFQRYSRTDIFDRLSVRTPRKEEMRTDQDWQSVWPAAKSFRSSVVPLPVRMGYTKMRDGKAIRPPFKTEGNLELVKIPNFLHLTPDHIKKHCAAIKKFCTEFPKELKQDASLVQKHLPVTIKYSDYVHQGTSIRDIRARVITLTVKLDDLNIDERAKDKFRRLVGNRYDEATDTFTVVTDRCYTRQQNRDYAEYLLTVLYHEATKVEEWEKLKERIDEWKLDFKGSRVEDRLLELVKLVKEKDDKTPPLIAKVTEPSLEKLADNDSVKAFAKTWNHYRNTPETRESVEAYGDNVRELLGIPKVTKQTSNLVEHK